MKNTFQRENTWNNIILQQNNITLKIRKYAEQLFSPFSCINCSHRNHVINFNYPKSEISKVDLVVKTYFNFSALK